MGIQGIQVHSFRGMQFQLYRCTGVQAYVRIHVQLPRYAGVCVYMYTRTGIASNNRIIQYTVI